MATFNSKAGFAGALPHTVLDAITIRGAAFTPLQGPSASQPAISPNTVRVAKRPEGRAPGTVRGCAGFTAKWLLIPGVWLIFSFCAAGGQNTNSFAARVEAEFDRARQQFQSNTNDVTAAWEFARACFDFADFATNDTEHAAIASQGINACRNAIAHDPNSALAHYYLGQNFGQLARTETLGALKLVRKMERELKTAIKLDGHIDYAGPERSLGLLYRDAPGWPMSIGSRRKALEWLKQAEKLAPDYPENHLNLLESYLRWHERGLAKYELHELDAVWSAARTNLASPYWARSWADWSARRDEARERLGETPEQEESSKKTHDSSN